MTPIELVKNYNELEDELFTKALRFLEITLLEDGWGLVFESLIAVDGFLALVIRYDGTKFYTVRFNDELEAMV